MPSLVAELVLREMGWQVRNLGINLPFRSLAHATIAVRPRLIFTSVSYVQNQDTFVSEYRSFYEAAKSVNAAVIVGGQALSPELRSLLVYASCGDRMAHLAEFAQRSRPAVPSNIPRCEHVGRCVTCSSLDRFDPWHGARKRYRHEYDGRLTRC